VTQATASVKDDFPLLREQAIAYLDNAATTQKPQRVLDALIGYYSTSNSNVGRGVYGLSMRSTDCYERARVVVQEAIGAADPREIVFTRSTTDALNLLTDTLGRQRVQAGDRVVVTDLEHNSNLLPWRRLCETVGAELVVVPVNVAGQADLPAFRGAIDERVRIAAISHVSNVLGTVNPVREMAAAAHAHGALIVVDGAQAVPHRRVDVRDLDVDFYCFSGHKVYGPMGIGVLYGRHDLLSALPPYQVGGGTVKGVSFEQPVEYVPTPARQEAGTPHVAGAVGLAAALEYVEELGRDALRSHDEHLMRCALDAIAGLERVHVIGDPGREPSGIVSVAVEGIHPYDVGGHMDQLGIAVRCGVHCAGTLLDALGLVGTVRLSFAVYNDESDIERACHALETVRPGFWTAEHPTTRFL
jgi:cysteine desulfurase/selenocysteine lyase